MVGNTVKPNTSDFAAMTLETEHEPAPHMISDQQCPPLMPAHCGLDFVVHGTTETGSRSRRQPRRQRHDCCSTLSAKPYDRSARAPAPMAPLRTDADMKRNCRGCKKHRPTQCLHDARSIVHLDDVQGPRPRPVRAMRARVDPAEPADRLPLQARLPRHHQPGKSMPWASRRSSHNDNEGWHTHSSTSRPCVQVLSAYTAP